MDEIKISVIIPVYNGEKYIREALDSIMTQSYKPFEVIVIDDGSEDMTGEIVASYGQGLVYFYQKNKGIAASRNMGVNISRGDYLCFLDADDIWLRKKLQLQKEILQRDLSIDIVFGMVQQFYSPETDQEFREKVKCPPEPMEGIHPGTMFIKRDTFLSVGLFSTDYRTGEFIDWYTKAREKDLKSYCLPEVLLKRRIHKDNYTLNNKQLKSDYARIVRDMLLRRKNKVNDK